MKPDVAARLLADATGLTGPSLHELVTEFRALADYKYDGYDGYRPGSGFMESLIQWLMQFQPNERQTAVDFARRDVVFISRREFHHLVALVYPSVIRPALLRQTSELSGIPVHRTAMLASSPEFLALQRATLIVGLSDGADLGLLRRLSPNLRHEQFLPMPDLSGGRLVEMVSTLRRDLSETGLPALGRFRSVVLVDDFSATGATLLRFENGCWDGRLRVAQRWLSSLVEQDALSSDHHVQVVLYLATDRAAQRLDELLMECGSRWEVRAIQTIGNDAQVTPDRHPHMYELCARYADGTSVAYVPNERGPLAFGCGGAALPLVLYHNTPDNSISLLWQNRREERSDRPIIPLFPRHERYP